MENEARYLEMYHAHQELEEQLHVNVLQEKALHQFQEQHQYYANKRRDLLEGSIAFFDETEQAQFEQLFDDIRQMERRLMNELEETEVYIRTEKHYIESDMQVLAYEMLRLRAEEDENEH